MGRRKLEIKNIENPTNRQVTYSKRRNGLMKKARELSVLCDIDIAVITFSPAGKMTEFCTDDSSIEKVITRYANIPQHERTKGRLENVEYLNKVAQKLTDERGLETPRVSYADLQLEVQQLKSQLKTTVVERNVSEQKACLFASNEFLNSLNSPAQLLPIRSELLRGLKNVQEWMGQLDRQLGSGVGPSTVQQTSFEMMSGLPARDLSNAGSTADSAQAMPMHNWGGVHNLYNPTSIMANSQVNGQLHGGDMDYSLSSSSLHVQPQLASPSWNHHHQGPM